MKVIAINSSRKNGNTFQFLKQIKKILKEKNIEMEIIHLLDYKIKYCIGCETCLYQNKCPINDDTNIIMNKLRDADGIILSSPVYMRNVTGKLKTFIDRTCRWFHRPELIAKPALLLSTTAGSALKSNLDYLEKVAIDWGLHPSNKIGRTVNNLKKEVELNEVSNFIDNLFKEKNDYKPSLKQIINFQVQRILAQKLLKIDHDYWKKRGWINSLYFYDCKIGIIKKTIAILFYKFLYKKINPL